MDGLAEPHFVSQDTVEAVIVEGDQPLQSYQLVVLEFAALENAGLLLDFLLDSVGEVVVDIVGVVEIGLEGLLIDMLSSFSLVIALVVIFLRGALLD